MGLKFYQKSEKHPRKFHGWKVDYEINGKRIQEKFSNEPPSQSMPIEFWERYQETKARLLAAQCEKKIAASEYCALLRKDSPKTKPYRGLGMQGITLGIGSTFDESKTHCYFAVDLGKSVFRVSITDEKPLRTAWEFAVDVWGEEYGIRSKDIARKKRQVPSPEKFKLLRRHLNDKERAHLPVWVLSEVYQEYRDDKLWVEAHGNPKSEESELLKMRQKLERDMKDFKSAGQPKMQEWAAKLQQHLATS